MAGLKTGGSEALAESRRSCSCWLGELMWGDGCIGMLTLERVLYDALLVLLSGTCVLLDEGRALGTKV